MHNSSPHAEVVRFVNSDDIRAQIEALFEQVCKRLTELLGDVQVEHIGSTVIPDSLTKGDLDVLVRVPADRFSEVKAVLNQTFSLNASNSGLGGFASFEAEQFTGSVGIQLLIDTATQPPFLQWRNMLMTDIEIKQEYDELKRRFEGKSMSDYRQAKEGLICKYLPDEQSNEYDVFDQIATRIQKILTQKEKPVRVAINGIEGTGKTIFAKKLAFYLSNTGFDAIHVSIDGFHYDKNHRYRQGRDSAQGYYEDSYDEIAFTEKVLIASQAEQPYYIPATHDLDTDKYLKYAPVELNQSSILVTDGAYLLKENYSKHWDLCIYLKTDFATALQRGSKRDAESLGGIAEAKSKFLKRYHAASKLYITECKPEDNADIVIDNTDFNNLIVLKQ